MSRRFRLRGQRLLVLALVGLVGLLTLVYFVVRKAEEFSPTYFTNTVLLSVLGFVNAILILGLLYVLFRNLIRLVVERRRGTLGSQFKTKLVVIFLGLTLIPSILLFVAAQKLIESSIKKWFSTPVEEVIEGSREATEIALGLQRDLAVHFARRVAEEIAARRLLEPDGRRLLRPAMSALLREYDLDLIVVHAGGEAPLLVADARLPVAALEALPRDLVERALGGAEIVRVDELGRGALVRAAVPVPGAPGAVLTAGRELPPRLADLTRRLTRTADTWRQTRALKNPIERSYYLVLILVAVLVLFATAWVGLALARRITEPIARLAEGTREVAAGNLGYQVHVEADDEFGILVDSFNRMTSDLGASRRAAEESNRVLAAANQELAERRHYIETLLETFTPGVISLDGDQRLTTINRSACALLGLERDQVPAGVRLTDLLGRPEHAELLQRVRTALAGGRRADGEQVPLSGGERTVSLAMTPLTGTGAGRPGVTLVLEDVTQLLRAEKVAAWQDVARRLAHEIKNPLTPIRLSAERIARRQREGSPDLARTVDEATGAIVREVDALKRLVDEFSLFARLPAAQRVPCDPNPVIEQAVALFDGLHPRLRFERSLSANGGPVSLDPEQMKRVFINLFDNAIEAMNGQGTITVRTRRSADGRRLQVEVGDDGPGVPAADRARLFVPYFSTKSKGTGLGLAIVQRIVADHEGTVRVEDNKPQGSLFIIDLPAGAAAPGEAA